MSFEQKGCHVDVIAVISSKKTRALLRPEFCSDFRETLNTASFTKKK